MLWEEAVQSWCASCIDSKLWHARRGELVVQWHIQQGHQRVEGEPSCIACIAAAATLWCRRRVSFRQQIVKACCEFRRKRHRKQTERPLTGGRPSGLLLQWCCWALTSLWLSFTTPSGCSSPWLSSSLARLSIRQAPHPLHPLERRCCLCDVIG